MEGSAVCSQRCRTTASESGDPKGAGRCGAAAADPSASFPPAESCTSLWTSNGGSDASTDVGADNPTEQKTKVAEKEKRGKFSGPGSSQSLGDKADVGCIPSKLDFFDPSSELASSPYRGFATLISAKDDELAVNIWFYEVAVRSFALRWTQLAVAMFYDFFYLMFMWFKLTVWSLTAFGLHLLFMKGYIGKRTLFALQHLTQAITIAYAVGHCLYNKWPILPAAFVQVAAVCNFMKMHSYTESNLEFYCKKDTPEACKHYPGNVSLIKGFLREAGQRDTGSRVFSETCNAEQLSLAVYLKPQVNFRNFCYYMVVPSLVYEPNFSRGRGFRPTYFLWKLLSLVSAMSVMYLACTSYLIPTISRSPTVSLMEAITHLIFPFLFLDLLIFFIVFECICNLLAEVTNFGNRDFYHDWWNSTNWDEYSRKWNRPVHKFLLRHVYMETQQKYRWSQRSATLATFLFSALLHEMIMAVCFRFVRFYLLSLMLLQIPLVALGRYYAHNRCLANAIFWACLLLGLPLLAVAYGREFAQEHFYPDRGGWQELRVI
ncbi:hypothetical protein Efla_005417 [Eimeria flavescens]